MSKEGDELREAADIADEVAELDADKRELVENVGKWLMTQSINNDEDIAKNLASTFNINLSDAKKQLDVYPKEYTVQDKTVPEIVKELRIHRRTLKGEYRDKMTKSIETLVHAYSAHLDDCIKSIYWLAPYEYPLKQMRYVEQDLKKIQSLKSKESRREVIDVLCKFWEYDLERKGLPYNKDYSELSKNMTKTKKDFRAIVKEIPHQKIRKSLKEQSEEYILKSVCERPGISSREIHESMPNKLYRRTSSHIISKMTRDLDITTIEGQHFKLPEEIKKDLYAYTAAFIDSDGYITMDTNYNPRVGLVATGDRGKAFMVEIQKALGIGKLHLDQKSPQNTRPVNRLNFYSQNEVRELLTKCLPHFRMKKANAELLLELIQMKKGHKKQEWYKPRMKEIFQLMKWENHKDHVNYDFSKYGIDPTTVAKLHDNCKVNIMNELENISTPILKEELPYGLEWFMKDGKKKFLLDKEGVRHAAGAAVFKGDKILIVERSPEEDTKIGMWEFAGGKIEEVDEFNEDGSPNAEKVCMIEVGEELGLKVKPTSKLGVHFDKNMNPPKKYHCFKIEVDDDWEPTLSFEHSDHKWVSLEELKDMKDSELSHHVRYLINKL